MPDQDSIGGVKMCDCRTTALGFTTWEGLTSAAFAGGKVFGNVPQQRGVYCIRASTLGEKEPSKVIERYLQSPLYAALRTLHEASEVFFTSGGMAEGWGWKW